MTAPDPARVEAVARATYERMYAQRGDHPGCHPRRWEDAPAVSQNFYREQAENFIAMADADAAWRAENEESKR